MPATMNTETRPKPTAARVSSVVLEGPGSSVRWWCAVTAGCGVALPIGWLLSYAATLPFMIGTFFFALLGLVIGAITFRVAGASRRYTRGAVVAGTTFIVLAGWGFSIYTEASDLPTVMAKRASNTTRDLGDRTVDEFRAAVSEGVKTYLRDHYPPGGSIGYVRWVIDSGRIPRAEIPLLAKTLPARQHGWVWLIRVALSVGLLGFGIASQTWSLARRVPSTA